MMDAGFRREPPAAPPDRTPDPAVAALIRAEIAAIGPIPFARFMELALYAPEVGYYTSAAPRMGTQGDFLTAPETHPIFGATVARQVADVWRLLGRPAAFTVREYGAGRGALAAAILAALATDEPDLAAALHYEAVEINPARRAEIADRVPGAGIRALDPTEAAAMPPVPAGVVLANEFLDAFPVHRVLATPDGLRELHVDVAPDGFREVAGPLSDPALARRLADEGITLPPGRRAEIAAGVDAWLAEVGRWLGSGAAIVIDYGADAAELYGPRHPGGTLVGYLGHRALDDPLAAVGRQDLTAHVDFTAVERAASHAGLAVLGRTTQAAFLVALGLEDLLERARSDPAQTVAGWTALRSAIVRLLDPRHTGGFGVLLVGRGLPADPPPAGLRRTGT